MTSGPVQPGDNPPANALGTGGIGSLLAHYSIPAIIGTAAASLYNIIDRVFIGHAVGPMAISGLALTFPLMNLAAAFGAVVGVGSGALVSIRLGQQRRMEANAILGNMIFLNVVLSISYSVLSLVFLDRILGFMGASPETLPFAKQFMQVILAGNLFTHLYLGMNNVMRASGYPRKAMLTTLVTVGVNVVLAPLFIFGFRWGIRGAALATVCAQIMGTAWALGHFTRPTSLVRLHLAACFQPRLKIILGIFSIGMSTFVMLVGASVITAMVNLRLGRYGGDYAIGAFGIINALAGLFIMITVGVNMGMQPISGYNFGAGKFDRVTRVFRMAVLAATCITTCGFCLGELFARQVAGAFTRDPELIRRTVIGLRFTFVMYPIVGFQMVTSTFFQSIGRAKISLVLSLSRQVLFLIPFLILLPLCWGLNGVWVAEPMADFTASITTFLVLRFQLRKVWPLVNATA
ncbi:MAG: MATE family efflux transporter [Holophaga sp.]|nr:MATE family efflux transporter [Holophaga sp.]